MGIGATWVAGDELTAANLNTRRGFNSRIKVVRDSSVQLITAAIVTQVQFNSEIYDTFNEYSTSTYYFTAANEGDYLVLCTVLFSPDASGGYITLFLDKNDNVVAQHQMVVNSALGNQQISISSIITCSATDTIRVRVYSSSCDMDINYEGEYGTFLIISRIA